MPGLIKHVLSAIHRRHQRQVPVNNWSSGVRSYRHVAEQQSLQTKLRERNDLVETGSIAICGIDHEEGRVEQEWFVAAAAQAGFEIGKRFSGGIVMTGMPRA